jgi:hypothetical protein
MWPGMPLQILTSASSWGAEQESASLSSSFEIDFGSITHSRSCSVEIIQTFGCCWAQSRKALTI